MAQIIICGGISLVPYIRPVGIHQLANVLRNEGYTVQVIDHFPYIAHLGPEYVKKLFDKFVDDSTLWIGYSSTWFQKLDFLKEKDASAVSNLKLNPKTRAETIETIKENVLLFNREQLEDIKEFVYKKNQNVKFVMGGAKATIGRGQLGNPLIDAYIEGYADDTVVEYTKWLEGKGSLLYKENKDNSIIINHDPKAVNFDYNNFYFQWHDTDLINEDEMLPIEIARGCIFNCAFCAYPLNGKKKLDYIKDPKILRKQFLDNYERFGTTKYFFLDDTFNESPDKLRILHDEVTSKLPFDIEFQAYLRLDLINAHPDTMYILRDMGIKGASFGVESLNYEANKVVGKGITLDKVLDISTKIKNTWTDTYIESQYIIGLPNDGEEELREWMDVLLQDDFPMPATQILPLHLDRDLKTKNLWMSKFVQSPEAYGYTFPDPKNGMYWVNNKGLTQQDAFRIRRDFEKQWQKTAKRTWMMQQGRKLLGLNQDIDTTKLSEIQMMSADGDFELRINFVKKYVDRLLSL